MNNDIFAFVMIISFLIIALFAAGILVAVFSAIIIYAMPNTRAAKWLEGVWFDDEETPDDVWNYKAGEVISPKRWSDRK